MEIVFPCIGRWILNHWTTGKSWNGRFFRAKPVCIGHSYPSTWGHGRLSVTVCGLKDCISIEEIYTMRHCFPPTHCFPLAHSSLLSLWTLKFRQPSVCFIQNKEIKVSNRTNTDITREELQCLMLWDFFLSTPMSTTVSSTQSTRNRILRIFFSQPLAFKSEKVTAPHSSTLAWKIP